MGYNDQGTMVSNVPPPSETEFNGPYFGYYGPVTFYTKSLGEVTIDEIAIQGNNTNLLSGTFTLGAGITPYATIEYGGGITPLPFLMMGQ
jgi:hypothetical protein